MLLTRLIWLARTGGNTALFFDLDHDGDLDIFEATAKYKPALPEQCRWYFSGTVQKRWDYPGTGNSRDAAFGDFDDDEDIDLFVVNEKGSNMLYSNQRQGIFKDVTEKSGLKTEGGSSFCYSRGLQQRWIPRPVHYLG